jgi:hypothetical protein
MLSGWSKKIRRTGTHQVLTYADDVNMLGEKNTININKEAMLRG